jgi:multiple sugar transport system permease protein
MSEKDMKMALETQAPTRLSGSTRPETGAKVRRTNPSKLILGALRYLAILVTLIFFLTPFVWMLLSSFKTQIDITTSTNIFKFNPTLENYQNVFSQYNFLLYTFNSMLVAVASTFLALVLGLPAAYAIARFKVGWLGLVLLTARIVPGITFLIPWYIIFSRLGLAGTYWALILSHMLVGLPFIAWIMISFFESLPIDLEEAAMVDGATPFGAFFRIALPLSVPGIITASIMSFIFSWNNFMFSLVLAGDQTRTLPVAIFNFISYSSVDWGGLMAAAVIITLPVLIISLIVQRYVVAGLTSGATKG